MKHTLEAPTIGLSMSPSIWHRSFDPNNFEKRTGKNRLQKCRCNIGPLKGRNG